MKFGIEYTFLVPGFENMYELDIRHIKKRDGLVNILKKKGFSRAYRDPGVVEVPSPPHRSLDEAKKFFDKLGKALALLPLVPRIIHKDKHGNEYHPGTGGGHIHVELPKGKKHKHLILKQLLSALANRPWINWVFNEFGDDANANSILGNELAIKYLKGAKLKKSALYLILSHYNLILKLGNFDMTVEFRMFDMPTSWKQTKDHIDFALALVSWAKKRVKQKQKPEKVSMPNFKKKDTLLALGLHYTEPDFTKQYKKLKDVKAPFKRLIKTLGLDWNRYKGYMRNFKDRLAFGKLT